MTPFAPAVHHASVTAGGSSRSFRVLINLPDEMRNFWIWVLKGIHQCAVKNLADGKSQQGSVDGPVIVNDVDLAVRGAVDGLGIAYATEAVVDPFLRSGQLVRVIEDWSPAFEGFFLYCHRRVPVALRALINMLRAARGPAPVQGLPEHAVAAD